MTARPESTLDQALKIYGAGSGICLYISLQGRLWRILCVGCDPVSEEEHLASLKLLTLER